MSWQQKPFRQLISPIAPETFLSEVFGQRFLHIPHPQDRSRFTELFSWASLNQLLNLSSDATAGIRIARDQMNYLIKKDSHTLGDILENLRLGGTLILEGIDRHDVTLAAFLDALSDELATQARINLYLSYPGMPGYPLHYDSHDFFILQIQGQKRWQIFPETVNSPLRESGQFAQTAQTAPKPTGPMLAELLMQPGDVLYLPKGYWHQALAEGSEPSLHLTLGLYVSTGLDLFQWLLNTLREQALFRRSFPLTLKQDLPAKAADPSPFAGHFQALSAELKRLLADPDLLHSFHQESVAGLSRRQAFSLPHHYLRSSLELDRFLQFKVRQVPHYLLERDSQLLELVYPKEKLKFSVAARGLLTDILSRTEFSRQQLLAAHPEFSWEAILEVLLPLVQDGIVVPQAA